jgi:ankyrin repeat protein
VPRLPADPSLEHLRKQAKALRQSAGDPQARALVERYHPDPPAQLKLADAQLVVARAYGFPSWPKLRAHLDVIARYTSSPHKAPPSADPADEFLRLACLTYSNDHPANWEAVRPVPEVVRSSLHTAAAAGDPEAARAHIAAAREAGGPHGWEPLLYLAYSRVSGDGALEVARLLLDAGADPNAGFLWEGLPSPFTVLTGAFGRGEGDPPPHRDGLALARLLLEAGADPTDAQATYNLHWTEEDAWLELLLEFGYGRGDGGPWHARLAPAHATPRETAEDCLMWAALEGFPRRVALLLQAGVDPDGRGTRHPIFEDRTALEVALREGHTTVADALRAAGAGELGLDRAQRVEAAYMAADATVTDPPPAGLIARAAARGNIAAVALLLERGADVNAFGERATALHEAAWRNEKALVETLLSAGADRTLRDREFGATPSGWAAHAGHAELAERLAP